MEFAKSRRVPVSAKAGVISVTSSSVKGRDRWLTNATRRKMPTATAPTAIGAVDVGLAGNGRREPAARRERLQSRERAAARPPTPAETERRRSQEASLGSAHRG